MHALVGWDFISLVAARLGVKLSDEHLSHIRQWNQEEENSAKKARDEQERIKTNQRRKQSAEMQRAHRDAWAATQTSRDAKQKAGELSSHQSRANRQQALGRGPVTCDCFFVAAASLPAESQSSQSQSASSSSVASGSARKSSELMLTCLLCRASFNASNKKGHAKGKGHGTRWHAQVSSQSAASSSSSSSSSSLPQCDCK